MLRPSLWFVTGQNAVCYDQVYDLLLVRTLYVTTRFMICYWSEHCVLRPSLWFVTGQSAVCYDQVYDLLLVRMPYVTISNSYISIDCCVHIIFYQVYDLLLVRTLCYDQVYDLLLVRTLYVTTRFMICYWSEHCMLRPSLWFVTGQNAVCYNQVYDFYWSEHYMLRTSWWFVTGQNTGLYDQVYDLLLVRTLYGMTKFMICYR